MDLICKQIIPYKSVKSFMYAYFRQYYWLNKSQRWHLLRPIFGVLTLKSFNSLMLAFYEPPSTVWKLITSDVIRLTNLPPEVHLVYVSCYVQGGYYLYLNYFEKHRSIAFLVDTITGVHGNNSIFISKNYQKESKGDKLRRLPVSEHIWRHCSLVLGLLQVFIIAIDVIIILLQYYGWKIIVNLSLPDGTTFLLVIAATEMGILVVDISLFCFSYSLMLSATIAFTLLEMVRLLLLQLEQQLAMLLYFTTTTSTNKKSKKSRKFQKEAERREGHFRRQYTQAVVNISYTDEHIGKAFLILLIINCPANALLTVTLISRTFFSEDPLDLEVQLTIIMAMIMQFLSFIVVHLLIASLNGRLKSLARSYAQMLYNYKNKGAKMFVYGKFTSGSKSVLKSNLFYANFHTKKSYGFTYHHFGHVSMLTFAKYCLLYGEALMFIFQSEMKN